MDLLFKREQTSSNRSRIKFKLWSKIELDDDEQAIVKRYHFDEAVLIAALQPTLLRNAILVGVAAFILIGALLLAGGSPDTGITVGLLGGVGAGFWHYHSKRETIFVRDLMHGRYSVCNSVVDLAKKEAWLEGAVGFLRQVMESAKHWDGTERHHIEPLPKDEARQVILQAL